MNTKIAFVWNSYGGNNALEDSRYTRIKVALLFLRTPDVNIDYSFYPDDPGRLKLLSWFLEICEQPFYRYKHKIGSFFFDLDEGHIFDISTIS